MRLAVPPAHERWLSPLAGLLTRPVTAATGVFVIPAVPYLQALGLEKEQLVRALGVSFLVSTIALAATLGHGGALDRGSAAASLLALLPALLGMFAGQALRRRIAAEPFRKVFFGGLLALGLYLAGRGRGCERRSAAPRRSLSGTARERQGGNMSAARPLRRRLPRATKWTVPVHGGRRAAPKGAT